MWMDGGHGANAPLPTLRRLDWNRLFPYALKYAICVVVASRRPFGDHNSPF